MSVEYRSLLVHGLRSANDYTLWGDLQPNGHPEPYGDPYDVCQTSRDGRVHIRMVALSCHGVLHTLVLSLLHVITMLALAVVLSGYERRAMALLHNRDAPLAYLLLGLGQPIADGGKLLMKTCVVEYSHVRIQDYHVDLCNG